MPDAPKPPDAPNIDPQVADAVGEMMRSAPPTPPSAAKDVPKDAPKPSLPPPHAHHVEDEAPDDSAPIGKLMRYWLWKYLGTLVMERQEDGIYVMSLGRVCTAALMAQAMWRWGISGDDIPQSMLQTLWILLGYLLGTKGISIANQWINPPKADAKAKDSGL